MRYNGPTAAVRDQFHQGTNRRAYEMLGAHPVTQDGQEMWHFAVWAPNARAVSLIGEFNQWDRGKTPMQKVYDGTWEVRLPAKTFDVKSDPKRYDYPDAAKKLTTYKYCIQAQDGTWQDKADPYGFAMQMRPDTASRIYDLSGYRWGDADWMEARKSYDPYHSPVNIYEMHLGSWRRHKDGTFLTYTEIAEQLVPYLKEMGYTHVEFMPVMEHPLDMSWGYQVSGYYAATARFGEPKELMALIDALHQAGIGQGTLERDQPQRLLLQFPEHLLVCQRRIDNQHIGSRFGDQFLQLFRLPCLDDLHVECRQPSKDITHTAAQNQRRLDQDDFQESAHRASRILRSTSATAGMNSLFSRSLWEASSDSQRKMSNNTPFISLPQLSEAG